MDRYLNVLTNAWLSMVESPWRHSGDADDRDIHWFYWIVGWVWVLAGLLGGALVAPSLVQAMGLADTAYQDWAVIVVALLSGFLVQLLGWLLITTLVFYEGDRRSGGEISRVWITFICSAILLPLVGVGYGIYRYLAWVGAGQDSVTIAFAAALLIKTISIPLIKVIVTGVALKWVIDGFRGKDKNSA